MKIVVKYILIATPHATILAKLRQRKIRRTQHAAIYLLAKLLRFR